MMKHKALLILIQLTGNTETGAPLLLNSIS